MTRKDFELIAEVLQDLYLGHNEWVRSLDQVATRFADRLAETNPAFDRDRFLKAAGAT